jgi:hypothetical protein
MVLAVNGGLDLGGIDPMSFKMNPGFEPDRRGYFTFSKSPMLQLLSK